MTERQYDQTAFQAQAADLLCSAFTTLNDWRHLPAYQLERRVDVFFGLLLPEIVEAEFGIERKYLEVIPEFPLRKGTLAEFSLNTGRPDTSEKDNRSTKVDFAVFSRDPKKQRLVIVELKTDNKSIDPDQLKRMEKARNAGLKELLRGVVRCACRSPEKRKYAQLIWKLKKIGCIRVPETFTSMKMAETTPGLKPTFTKLCRKFSDYYCDSWSNAAIEFALIYPGPEAAIRSSKVKEFFEHSSSWLQRIDFCSIGTSLEENPLSSFLKCWAKCEAGKVNPWDV